MHLLEVARRHAVQVRKLRAGSADKLTEDRVVHGNLAAAIETASGNVERLALRGTQTIGAVLNGAQATSKTDTGRNTQAFYTTG
ncbi:hypothetical protein AAVH_23535 [Aphelenchoides avenae]|nr:hypothetical protein AAVH_23535 [Aphelenchus avenae]